MGGTREFTRDSALLEEGGKTASQEPAFGWVGRRGGFPVMEV
jgi:hypothetical protein